jgi:hypothetical protein
VSTALDINPDLVLIAGHSGTGKSASLRNIPNQNRWLYLNCEAGKQLPFKNNFDAYRISDPHQVLEAFDYAMGAGASAVDGIIIDSLTFLLDMYESQYVLTATNTMQAWGNFAQFFKTLMQQKVVLFGKPVIFIAHVREELDEKSMEMRTAVPVKGSLKNNGIEAYFSTVVASKKVTLKELEKQGSSLLNITDDDKELGYKHVFQTRITKNTIGERIRSPMGLFSSAETFMDNDAALLLFHLKNFYN